MKKSGSFIGRNISLLFIAFFVWVMGSCIFIDSDSYYNNLNLVFTGVSEPVNFDEPTCSIKVTSGSINDTLMVNVNDSTFGVSYSYNNSNYTSNNVIKIPKGEKVDVMIRDRSGNVDSCTNYRTALILVGDSRTYWLQKHLGQEKILTSYDDIYAIESYDRNNASNNQEVYAVARSGATIDWLLGKAGEGYNSGAFQVEYLLDYLASKDVYYNVIIATNLGVNDINKNSVEEASSLYISSYNRLLNFSERVIVDSKNRSCSWKKSGNIMNIDFRFISVNPIDEELLNIYKSNNNRRTNDIISYNKIMKEYFGNSYVDSYSNFTFWFNSAVVNGESKFDIRECIDNEGETYDCEDGLHYSAFLNKYYIYPFYKEKLLS